MSKAMDKVDQDLTGDGKVLMSTVDISRDDLCGRDLYLWMCNTCGGQTLTGAAGGALTGCSCANANGAKVTVINQQTREDALAGLEARHAQPVTRKVA